MRRIARKHVARAGGKTVCDKKITPKMQVLYTRHWATCPDCIDVLDKEHEALPDCENCHGTGECPSCEGTGGDEEASEEEGRCDECGGDGNCHGVDGDAPCDGGKVHEA